MVLDILYNCQYETTKSAIAPSFRPRSMQIENNYLSSTLPSAQLNGHRVALHNEMADQNCIGTLSGRPVNLPVKNMN